MIKEGWEHVPDELANAFRKLGQLEPRTCPYVLTLTEGSGAAAAAFMILWDEVLFLVDFVCTDGMDRAKTLEVLLQHACRLVQSTPRVAYVGFLSSLLGDWCCLSSFARGELWPYPEREGRDPPLIAQFSGCLARLLGAKTVRNSAFIFFGEGGLSRSATSVARSYDEGLLRWWSDACGRPVFCIGKIPLM